MSDHPFAKKDLHSRRLPCRLTEGEKIERCKELAGAVELVQEAREALDHQKERVKDAKEVVDNREGRVQDLSKVIASGTETRDVECKTVLDYDGKVVVSIRTDTDAVVAVRNMTDAELQTEIYEDGEVVDIKEFRKALKVYRDRGGEGGDE